MKLCTYVGYHDANNVSTFSVDPVTQLHFKKRFKKVIRDLQSSILLQSARDRVATVAKTLTASRLCSAMPVISLNNTRFVKILQTCSDAHHISYKYMLLVWPT